MGKLVTASSDPSLATVPALMAPSNPRDPSDSLTPTETPSTLPSSLMLRDTSPSLPLSQLPPLSPTQFPNSSLTRSPSLPPRAPRKAHTHKYDQSLIQDLVYIKIS